MYSASHYRAIDEGARLVEGDKCWSRLEIIETCYSTCHTAREEDDDVGVVELAVEDIMARYSDRLRPTCAQCLTSPWFDVAPSENVRELGDHVMQVCCLCCCQLVKVFLAGVG